MCMQPRPMLGPGLGHVHGTSSRGRAHRRVHDGARRGARLYGLLLLGGTGARPRSLPEVIHVEEVPVECKVSGSAVKACLAAPRRDASGAAQRGQP